VTATVASALLAPAANAAPVGGQAPDPVVDAYTPSPVVTASGLESNDGFDWGDAGIGAAAMLAFGAIAAGAAVRLLGVRSALTGSLSSESIRPIQTIRGGAMLRLCRVFLVVAAIAAVTAPSAGAAPNRQLSGLLGDMWTTLLETPAADNPFTGGDPCIALRANIVAPFAGGEEFTCVVKPGTRIFVAAESGECSTVEGPPFHGENEAELRACARDFVAAFEPVTATLDGRPIALTQVQTALLNFVLPPDNVFELPPGTTGQSVGDGWVALLHPLRPGSHEIQIFTNGTLVNTTTIRVQPRT
jgi:hypothetical protein